MATPGVAVPGSVVASGSLASPGGPQGIQGIPGPAGSGGGGGAGTKTIARFSAYEAYPPLTANAAFSAAAGNGRPYIAFDNASSQSILFNSVVPQGAVLTSGIIVDVFFFSALTTGNIRFTAAIDRLVGASFIADSFDTAAGTTGTPNGTANIPGAVISITLTTIDSLAAQEPYVLKLLRDTTVASNTTSPAFVFAVAVRTP
jgi:hypothetical protein